MSVVFCSLPHSATCVVCACSFFVSRLSVVFCWLLHSATCVYVLVLVHLCEPHCNEWLVSGMGGQYHCRGCKRTRPTSDFAKTRLRSAVNRFCKDCVAAGVNRNGTYQAPRARTTAQGDYIILTHLDSFHAYVFFFRI